MATMTREAAAAIAGEPVPDRLGFLRHEA